MRWTVVIPTGLVAVAFLAAGTANARAQDACVACHSVIEARIEVFGRIRSARIDMKRFDGGVHQGFSCDFCHTEQAFTHFPHEVGKSIDAVLTSADGACGGCHDTVAARFAESIHATAKPEAGRRLPVCSTCHDPHSASRG